MNFDLKKQKQKQKQELELRGFVLKFLNLSANVSQFSEDEF